MNDTTFADISNSITFQPNLKDNSVFYKLVLYDWLKIANKKLYIFHLKWWEIIEKTSKQKISKV